MIGYLNNKNRILNEWYQLFIQKDHIISHQDHENWNRIHTCKLPYLLKKNNQKYTFIKNFLKYNFVSIENKILNTSQYKKFLLPIDAYRLVFVNGQFSAKLSDPIITPWTVTINKKIFQDTTFTPIQPNFFSYLTECLSNITVYIHLPKGQKTYKPLYLLYINEGSDIQNKLITSHYHHYLNIEDNTNTSVIEHFISVNENKHFTGTRTFINIGNHSKLHHVRLVFENNLSYHTSHHDINIGHFTNIDSNTFIISGPKFTYHQTNAKINHSESSVYLNSLMLLGDTNIGNIHTYVEHNNKSYALSRQLHKIIACNYSTGIFNGLIKVNPNAIKADGKMTNNNLLLHPNATICSTPKLEIYSDNVQCSHGTTIGQINTDHLFYLITRGISEKDALKKLIYAFAVEVTETIQNNFLKNIILTKIDKTLTRSLYEHLSYKKN